MHSMQRHALCDSCLMLVLCQSVMPNRGEGGMDTTAYSVSASALMRLTVAEFPSYENAWSVFFEAGQVDDNNVLLLALCRVPSTGRQRVRARRGTTRTSRGRMKQQLGSATPSAPRRELCRRA